MSFLQAPEYLPEVKEWCRRLSRVVNQAMQGKTNNTSETAVTLTANATTTTVTEAPNRIGEATVILFMPTTANAAAAMANIYVSSRSVANNTFTITHANTATVDRTFNYVLVG
jgi:hypothetical protein